MFEPINSVSDWGSVGYYLGAIVYSQMGTTGHSSNDQAKRLRNGDKLKVMLPNGDEVDGEVKIEHRTVTIHDMGRPQEASSEIIRIVLGNGLEARWDEVAVERK